MRETRGTREFQDIFFHPAVVVIHWFFSRRPLFKYYVSVFVKRNERFVETRKTFFATCLSVSKKKKKECNNSLLCFLCFLSTWFFCTVKQQLLSPQFPPNFHDMFLIAISNHIFPGNFRTPPQRDIRRRRRREQNTKENVFDVQHMQKKMAIREKMSLLLKMS